MFWDCRQYGGQKKRSKFIYNIFTHTFISCWFVVTRAFTRVEHVVAPPLFLLSVSTASMLAKSPHLPVSSSQFPLCTSFSMCLSIPEAFCGRLPPARRLDSSAKFLKFGAQSARILAVSLASPSTSSANSCAVVHQSISVALCLFQLVTHMHAQSSLCTERNTVRGKKCMAYRFCETFVSIFSFCSHIFVSINLDSECIFESNFYRLWLNESIWSCISCILFKYSAVNLVNIMFDCYAISSRKCVSAFLRCSTSIFSSFFKDYILSSTCE